MEEWIEIEGRNKEEAIERACIALNTTRPYLAYEMQNSGKNFIKIRARKLEERPAGSERAEEREAEPEHEERDTHNVRTAASEPRDDDEEAEEIRPPVAEEAPKPQAHTDVGRSAQEALVEILKYIDEKAKVELDETEEAIRLEIMGDGSGIFIGKHGQTLEALQHLVAKMMGLDRSEGKRLTVDSEDYRSRRQESLASLARKVASRAKREGRPMSFEPMSAMDRRILHLTLQNDPDVTTKSIGEGRNRKVLVVPKEGRSGGGHSNGRGRGRGRSNGPRSGPRSGPRRNNEGPRSSNTRQQMPANVRLHDSFDVPPEPDVDKFAEEYESPLLRDGEEGQEMEEAPRRDTNAHETDD